MSIPMSKPPSKSPSKAPSKTPSKQPAKNSSKDTSGKRSSPTPEEQEAIRRDQERIRQEEVLNRMSTSGCICGGTGAPGPHGLTLALEAEVCRRSVRRSKEPGEPSGMWMRGPALAQPRWHCCAAPLGDGRLLVVGGFDEFGLPLDTTEVVDFVSGEVEVGPKLLYPRAGSAAVTLPLPMSEEDDPDLPLPWVLVVGGYGPDAGSSTEVLDLEALTSHPGPRLLTRRACCVASMYGEDEVIIAGGFDEFASVSSTEFIHLFNLKKTAVAEPHSFGEADERRLSEASFEDEEVPEHPADLGRAISVLGPEMLERRAACAAVGVPKLEQDRDGCDRVWIIGGTNEQGQRLQTSEWIEVVLNDSPPRPGARKLSLRPKGERHEAEPSGEAEPSPKRTEDEERGADDRGDEEGEHGEHESEREHAERQMQMKEGEEQRDEDEESRRLDEREGATPEVNEREADLAEMGQQGTEDGEDRSEAIEAEAEPEATATPVEVATEEAKVAGREMPPSKPKVVTPPQSSRTFQRGPDMMLARSGLAAVRLSDVVVLIAGGVGADGGQLDSTEFFDFEDRGEAVAGPNLSWGCDSHFGFGYCAASRTIVE